LPQQPTIVPQRLRQIAAPDSTCSFASKRLEPRRFVSSIPECHIIRLPAGRKEIALPCGMELQLGVDERLAEATVSDCRHLYLCNRTRYIVTYNRMSSPISSESRPIEDENVPATYNPEPSRQKAKEGIMPIWCFREVIHRERREHTP